MKKIITAIFAILISFGIYPQIYAQNDTMFIHIGQTVFEFPTKDVDSIIFYRTQPAKPLIDYSKIKINEVSGVGNDDAKFYEFINTGNVAINMAGMTMYYNNEPAINQGDGSLTWTGCADQEIQPGELLVLMGRNGGNTPQEQRDPCSFTTGLTAQRNIKVTLRDPAGNLVDMFTRAKDTGSCAFTDKSFSRIPDGTGPFYFTTLTPSLSNGTSTEGLVLVPQTQDPQTPIDPDTARANFYKHPVFDLSTLSSITIEVTEEEWNKMLSDFDINSHNEEKYPANFIYTKNGVDTKLDNIAFRLRGNTSRRRPEGNTGEVHNPDNPTWRNAHFSIDFREYEKNQRLFGLRKLILKWHNNDPMFCREVFSYDLFAKFGVWTAPRVAYTKLYVKVENSEPTYFGMYVIVEQPDETFVENRNAAAYYNTATGNFWKCTYTGGSNGGPADLTTNGALNKMGVEDIYLDESQSLRYSYDLKTNKGNIATAKTDFNNWINNLNTLTGDAFKTWISENLDVDLFLKAYAVNIAVGMWDDYWGNANNYYLYFENTTGKAYFSPYDYDNALGTTWENFDAAKEDVLRWGGSTNAPLVTKILEIPEFREQYIDYLNQLIDSDNDLFYVDKSIDRIEKWHEMIKDYLESDCIETGEASHTIQDRAADWGDKGYKLFERGNMNFFEVKEAAIKNATEE